jgi:RNA polymerase sigma factor for flagellar operon FliA
VRARSGGGYIDGPNRSSPLQAVGSQAQQAKHWRLSMRIIVAGVGRMTEDERSLWESYCKADETAREKAREKLILFYLPLVTVWAKRVSRIAGWANWEDLKQDGIIGLMNAIKRFDVSKGVKFKYFASPHIRGAIFDSSEFTRDLARRQEEIYRKIRRAESVLTKALQRNPTIEEVAEKTELTIEQIQNAIDAMGVAFAGELPDAEVMPAHGMVETPRPERAIMLVEALSQLNAREQETIHRYYWESQPHEEIAQTLALTVSNVIKIRQRAIGKLRKRLDVTRQGGHDEDRRSGE